jgi:hypothetical protein
MRVHSPSSRSGSRIYLSLWDVFWALVSPILALYLRDVDLHFDADWSAAVYYWVLSAGFAILAFFAFRLQDGILVSTAFRVQYRSSMDYCSRLGSSQPESSCASWPAKTMNRLSITVAGSASS